MKPLRIELIIGIAIGTWAVLGIALPAISLIISQVTKLLAFGVCY